MNSADIDVPTFLRTLAGKPGVDGMDASILFVIANRIEAQAADAARAREHAEFLATLAADPPDPPEDDDYGVAGPGYSEGFRSAMQAAVGFVRCYSPEIARKLGKCLEGL